MPRAICSGKGGSSLPLSIPHLMAFPAKQCIIYVSSMALFRLSARMKMCNFLWAEIISSAPAPLHLLFSNVSALTFCHRIAHWWFSQGEDMHKGKSNKKLLCACDSHPHNFKVMGTASAALAWSCPDGQRCVTDADASSSPQRWLYQLTLLALWETSNLKAPLISKSLSFTPRLFIFSGTCAGKCMLYFNPMKEGFLKYIYLGRQLFHVRSQWVVNNRLDNAKEIKNYSKITGAAVVSQAKPSPFPSSYLDNTKLHHSSYHLSQWTQTQGLGSSLKPPWSLYVSARTSG